MARRRWPDLLISWTRLLSGRLRDPLVGRDILVGILAGASVVLVVFIQQSVPAFANVSAMTPLPPLFETLGSLGQLVSWILGAFAPILTLAIMALLVLLSVLLRRRWLAIAVSSLALTLIYLAQTSTGPCGTESAALAAELDVVRQHKHPPKPSTVGVQWELPGAVARRDRGPIPGVF